MWYQWCFDLITAAVDFVVGQVFLLGSENAKDFQKIIDQQEEAAKQKGDSNSTNGLEDSTVHDSQKNFDSDIALSAGGAGASAGVIAKQNENAENAIGLNDIENISLEQKELDQWKFNKYQMQMFIYVGGILGCVLAGFGVGQLYLLRYQPFEDVFVIHCGVHGDFSVWEPDGLPGELLVSDHMMFTMFYIVFYYTLYWIVPYRFNQIKKTQKEVSLERRDMPLKALSPENKYPLAMGLINDCRPIKHG